MVGLTWMEECLFYGSRVCLRCGHMDDGSDSPLYRREKTVKGKKTETERRQRVGLHCTMER